MKNSARRKNFDLAFKKLQEGKIEEALAIFIEQKKHECPNVLLLISHVAIPSLNNIPMRFKY